MFSDVYYRALLIVSYVSYCEVYHGNHMGHETMQICSGITQVTCGYISSFIAALKYWNTFKQWDLLSIQDYVYRIVGYFQGT